MGRLGVVTAIVAAVLLVVAGAATGADAQAVPRPVVSWIDATPESIPAAGGAALVRVNVRHAVWCVFARQHGASAPFVYVKAVKCASGHASVRAKVTANLTSHFVAVRFRVTATNAKGQAVSTKIEVTQGPGAAAAPSPPTPAPTPLAVSTTSLPSAAVGVAYSTSLVATGGTTPYTWSVASGSLPPGLTLGGTGSITGTPTAPATWTFAAQVTDSQGQAASATYSIAVAPAATPVPTTPIYVSNNWSGYVLTGSTYTAVTGTFNIPTISTSPTDTRTSEWVGVDGVPGDPSLLQAGVDERYSAAANQYLVDAWVEELPAPETPIPHPVTPGNEKTITNSQISSGIWNVLVKNDSTGQYYSVNAGYAGSGLSAEWIVEAPTVAATGAVVTVGIFSPVTFTQLGVNPVSGSPARWVLVQNGVTVSVPSALTANGFTVAYGSVTPGAP